MNSDHNLLNNREIALFIWLALFAIFVLAHKSVRVSFFNVLKSMTNKLILFMLLLMSLYILLEILFLKKVGFWDKSMIKDSIIWTLTVAFVMLMNFNKSFEDDNYFKSILLKNFKFTFILDFIVNFYVFNLAIEMVLSLVFLSLAITIPFTAVHKEYSSVKKLNDSILGILGIVVFVIVLYNIIMHFNSFATLDNLRFLLLPLILTLVYLPFIYITALRMLYQNFFFRLSFSFRDNNDLLKYAKWKIFTICYINFARLRKFSKGFIFYNINSIEEFELALKDFKY